jgi:ABC-2 type transport system ATP-binding protein
MINITNLNKSYKKKPVLNDFNLQIDTGLITAVVGPNGTGKSTLMKILINSIFADSGSVDFTDKELTLSFMSEDEVFPPFFKVKDILKQEALLRGIPVKEVYNHPAAKTFRVAEFQSKKWSELSKGMSRKTALSKAMLSNPGFTIMDEPFDGVDTIGRDHLISLLSDRREKGMGALLSSHILHDMDDFCDHVCFLVNGRAGLQLDLKSHRYVILKNADMKVMEQLNGEASKVGSSWVLKKEFVSKVVDQHQTKPELFENNVVNEIYKELYGDTID